MRKPYNIPTNAVLFGNSFIDPGLERVSARRCIRTRCHGFLGGNELRAPSTHERTRAGLSLTEPATLWALKGHSQLRRDETGATRN